MATLALDGFADTNWKYLTAHSASVGGTWVQHSASSGYGRWYIYANRTHHGSALAGGASYYSLVYLPAAPASADYSVVADMVLYTNVPGLNLGLAGRVSTTQDTYYGLYYQDGELVLFKRLAGVTTTLGTWVTSLSYGGTTYRMRLEMVGTAITAYVDDVARISATDGDITDAGRAGLRAISAANPSEGINIDNFWAYDTSVAARPTAQVVGIVGL